MTWKKIEWGLLSLFCLYFLHSPANAQVTFSNILATNINADGAIVELDLPMELDSSVYVLIAWVTSEGKQSYVAHVARGGKQIYEMRHHPLWQGWLKAVAVNLNGVTGEVRSATFIDEIKIFLTPERLMPATINMLNKNELFRWSWNLILLGLLGCFAAFFYWKMKTRLVVSLFIGFVITWGVMDLRKIYDHFMIVDHMTSHQLTVPKVLNDFKIFINGAAEKIGENSWRTEGLGVLHLHMAEYSLADRKYALREPSDIPADLIITQTPKNREIIWQYGQYYLVKGKNP